MFDCVIIGGGISGLYAYEKLQEQGYQNIILLEGNNYIGGRMGIDEWYNARLSIGAGIGRKSKDKLLQQLCDKYQIVLKEFDMQKDVSEGMMTETELRNTIRTLINDYDEQRHKELTFRQYGMEILGAERYQQFMKSYDYTDMEKADTNETLKYYGFDDGFNGWTGLSVPWDELLEKMSHGKRIKLNEYVIKINTSTEPIRVETERHIYITARVIIATTVDTVRKLLPNYKHIYRQVEGQPFMRIYGKFGREAATLMQGLVPRSRIVSNQLKRIIPISQDVYMIVYCDNSSAIYMEHHVTGNDKESRELLSSKLEKGLGAKELPLTAIKKYYWPIGTHYMRPFLTGETYETWIQEAQKPMCNVMVVGEAFSRNQGWVEGALESVEAIIKV